jgi:hypothetical protein
MSVPAAAVAPLVASLGGRIRRERQLLLGYVAQAVVMTAGAIAFAAGAPPLIVYGLATLTSMSVTLTRPAHGSILPSLAATTDELTAANVASGTVQNISIAIAPFAAGLIYAESGPGAVFAICAAGVAIGAVLVAGVRTVSDESIDAGEPVEAGNPLDGLRFLRRAPGPRLVVALLGAAAVIEGALDVLMIVVAIDLVGGGPTEAGALSSAAGVGGIVGAAAAVTLVGRPRLAGPFALGLLVWSGPVAILGIAPSFLLGLVVFLVAGSGRGGLDVAGRTLLQRVTPDPALPGVFGVLEGVYMGMIAIGSVVIPLVIVLVGAHVALVVVGLWLPIVVGLAWRRLRAVDAAAVVHVHELARLRATPMFAPLAPSTVERLSANLVPVELAAETSIIRQGDRGDRFYIVDEGEVAVEIDGHPVRTQGPGSSFGEIALLRDVPRTASVRASTDVRLLALERDVFLSAVTGHTRSRTAAEAVVAERLGSG